VSADLCPTTGEMHRADWAECEHCGYPTPEDRAAVEDTERYLCHCGEPIHIYEDGFTRGLCQHCSDVRCDTWDGDCGRKFLVRYPPRRFWFYRPELYWYGWRTLWPIDHGGDEWGRWTLVLGWSITGQIVIALWQMKGELS
jgi:hypothetical protein